MNLNDLVKQIGDLTKPNWQNQAQAKGVQIDVETNLSDLSTIQVNASEIRETLINMVINAVDAMPDGGTLSIRTGSEGTNAYIEVADTGTGMTDEIREQCFNLFFSTKGERGSDLGLGVAQGIVRRHGGVINVESEPDKGTTFKIYLPIAGVVESITPTPESATATELTAASKFFLSTTSRGVEA